MRTTLLSPADYRKMPWKNGLGTTHEIWVERTAQDAITGGFRARLSIATVSVGSPFSRFAGCDRVIVLLDGAGMRLDSGPGRQQMLSQPHQPYAFSGDWDTDCTLIAGPCRDFNVIVDRQRARAEVRVISLGPAQKATLIAGPHDELWALFVLQGAAMVSDPDQPPLMPPQSVLCEHTLLRQGSEQAPLAGRLQISAEGGETRLLWIAIRTPDATAADSAART